MTPDQIAKRVADAVIVRLREQGLDCVSPGNHYDDASGPIREAIKWAVVRELEAGSDA